MGKKTLVKYYSFIELFEKLAIHKPSINSGRNLNQQHWLQHFLLTLKLFHIHLPHSATSKMKIIKINSPYLAPKSDIKTS